MNSYRVKHGGERLDRVARAVLGTTAGTVEALLEVNAGLAELSPLLPEGTMVHFPAEVPAPPDKRFVQVWE